MRAIVVEEFGPPESLTVQERPEPEPGPGQVRIRVEAAGVNYVDSIMASGGLPVQPARALRARLRGGGHR